MLEQLKKIYSLMEDTLKVYRGENTSNKNGHYWSVDKEFARQFTQSGLDKEIKSKLIDTSNILILDPLPSANSEQDIQNAINIAKDNGYKGFIVSEGKNQPNSVFLFN